MKQRIVIDIDCGFPFDEKFNNLNSGLVLNEDIFKDMSEHISTMTKDNICKIDNIEIQTMEPNSIYEKDKILIAYDESVDIENVIKKIKKLNKGVTNV